MWDRDDLNLISGELINEQIRESAHLADSCVMQMNCILFRILENATNSSIDFLRLFSPQPLLIDE